MFEREITLATISETGIGDLPALYATLHARASAADNVFISLATAKQLQERLDWLRENDYARALPLHGVPFVAKDNMDAPPFKTTNACPAAASEPQRAAPVVEHLLNAGAVLLGKTNMDQFASGLVGTRSPYGIVRNVHDPEYVAGGSSSGSAAAVALGLAAFALGTDTAGSGRVPAAMQGIVGLKPTKGVLSTSGVRPACVTLDCVSIFAHSTLEAAAVYAVLSPHYDDTDPFMRSIPPDRLVSRTLVESSFNGVHPPQFSFGVPDATHLCFDGDDVSRDNFHTAIHTLESIGGRRVDIDFESFAKVSAMLYGSALVAERFAANGPFIKHHIDIQPQAFDPSVASIILASEKWSGHQVFTAMQAIRALCNVAHRNVWPCIDFLVVPSVPRPIKIEEVNAQPIEKNALLGRYTNFVNLMDYCAIALPVRHSTKDKLTVPRGCTIIAPAFKDKEILALAHIFEQSNS